MREFRDTAAAAASRGGGAGDGVSIEDRLVQKEGGRVRQARRVASEREPT